MIISGGNFHGEYPAKAMDYLTIGIHEIASVAERRVRDIRLRLRSASFMMVR